MPLVKAGRIVEDRYVRWLGDAPVPEGAAVIVPDGRLVADASLLRRDAPTGVIWPNNRKVSELAPYVDRLALIALVFPVFKDGRVPLAYALKGWQVSGRLENHWMLIFMKVMRLTSASRLTRSKEQLVRWCVLRKFVHWQRSTVHSIRRNCSFRRWRWVRLSSSRIA